MDNLLRVPFTGAAVKAGLAHGTTTTLSTTSLISGNICYAIRGKAYSHADWSNQATPTTDANSGNAFTGVLANNGCVFVIGLNAAGSMKVVQGTIVPLDSTGAFIQAPQFPDLPDDFAPIGYLVIKAGSTADATHGWRFGTDNTNSVTGITFTFVDIVGLPDRPQVS